MDGNASAMKGRRAFTLIEIVLTIGIGSVIFGVVGFLAIRWFEARQLEIVAKTLTSYLRTAAVRAIQSEGGADQGVSRAGGRFTLFRGSSYAARQQSFDTVFPYLGGVQVTGPVETVFSRQSGLPSVSGPYTLTNGFRTDVITLYSTGAVSGP